MSKAPGGDGRREVHPWGSLGGQFNSQTATAGYGAEERPGRAVVRTAVGSLALFSFCGTHGAAWGPPARETNAAREFRFWDTGGWGAEDGKVCHRLAGWRRGRHSGIRD